MNNDECDVRAESRDTPDHVHRCSGKHQIAKVLPHFCPDCRRWWYFG